MKSPILRTALVGLLYFVITYIVLLFFVIHPWEIATVWTATGVLLAVLLIQLHTEIADRGRAEVAAHASEERFRLLVESVQDYAIFMLDPTGHVVSWNAGAARLKGYTNTEIIGQHFSRFYPPEALAEQSPENELAVTARVGRFEGEGWRIRKDGTRFWANVVITAIRNDTGELQGFAKVTRDSTERQAILESLEHKVAERTAEVQEINNQLMQELERRVQTEEALRAAHDRYAYQANHDPLTGLLNRLAIMNQMRDELARSSRDNTSISVALIDIDHFKTVNDQYGHPVGDQALCHTAQILAQTIRPYDRVGRWGGEEFLVVLANTTQDDAVMIAERLRTQIMANPMQLPDQTDLLITVSIGVACAGFSTPDTDDLTHLIQYADMALYVAKNGGRNRVSSASFAAWQ